MKAYTILLLTVILSSCAPKTLTFRTLTSEYGRVLNESKVIDEKGRPFRMSQIGYLTVSNLTRKSEFRFINEFRDTIDLKTKKFSNADTIEVFMTNIDTAIYVYWREDDAAKGWNTKTIETVSYKITAPRTKKDRAQSVSKKKKINSSPVSVSTSNDQSAIRAGSKERTELSFTDVPASFPGGPSKLKDFLRENLEYPQFSVEHYEEGKVYVKFVVETTGKISQIGIAKGVSYGLNREAYRVVSIMPDWTPAIVKGKAVNSYFNLPISFFLN